MAARNERKSKRWIRTARVRIHALGRFLRRHQTAIFCSVLIPLGLLTAASVAAYVHYSKIIDLHMQGGPFADAVNVYGAPLPAPLTAKDAGTLRQAGYTFTVSGSTIVPLLANLSAGREKRELVTFDQIPKVLVNAVSSVEDKRFFRHDGIDVPRMLKAAYVDFRSGRKEQGASTLTMQLVRDLYLDKDKKWKRKIAEAMMTIHLEREWSKEKIFDTYANEVYLGRQGAYSIHGFAEGAEVFFGKHLADLTLPEAATLAGMVQRPSYLNPYRNPHATEERRDLVLSLMRANRYITAVQYETAVDTPLTLSGHASGDDVYGTSYFLDLVMDDLENIQKDEGSDHGIDTTIDLNLQRDATEAIQAGMAEVDKRTGRKAEAALIAIDPHTGEIKAVVGGRDYARSQLNRVLAKRPPGSVFKPFVYATAIESAVNGASQTFTPASMVDDSPQNFGSYQPANFRHESFGNLTFRQALARSDNVAAVKVAEMVGYKNVVTMARRAGLNGNIQPTPSVALGAYDVTPLEMAGAYTAFANGGVWVKPHIIANVGTDSHLAMDPRVAYLITNMMEEVLRTGTGAGVRSRGFIQPAAGKTGTSHDGWFAGFTSNLLCVVWVGFDDYKELGLEGAKSALPIWTAFMKKAAHNGKAFPMPGGIESARICNRSGKLAGDYCTDTRTEVFIAGTQPVDQCDLDIPLPLPTVVMPVMAPLVDPPQP
jgi:penicillin-binding protein 1B